MGIKSLNLAIQFNAIKSSKPLQQAKSAVTRLQFLVNTDCYGHRIT